MKTAMTAGDSPAAILLAIEAIGQEVRVLRRRLERRLDALADRLDELDGRGAALDEERAAPQGRPFSSVGDRGGRDARGAAGAYAGAAGDPAHLMAVLRGLTARQHGTLQLLLEGAQNEDLVRVFGRDLSTVKGYVMSVCRAFGESRRLVMLAKVAPLWERLDPDEYLRVRGLPLDWGKRAIEAVKAGRKVDLRAFEERRGRQKGAPVL